MKVPHFVAAIVLAAAPHLSLAAEKVFCVGTDAQLQQAFQLPYVEAIGTGGRASVLIKLRRRATPYVLGELPGSAVLPFGGVTIKGGYSADPSDACSAAGRILEPDDTRLDTGVGGETLWISRESLIEGVTFVGDGFSVTYIGDGDERVTVSTVISELTTGFNLSTSHFSPDVTLRVLNSYFTNVESAQQTSCLLTFEGIHYDASSTQHYDNHTSALLANSTVLGSENVGVCVEQLLNARVTNSIIWANSFDGIRDLYPLKASPVQLEYNVLQADNSIPGQAGPHVGGLSTDPLLLANSQPSAQSPALDSGSSAITPDDLPASDAAGNPRVVGPLDRGAFERQGASADIIVVDTLADPDGPPGTTSLNQAVALANQSPGIQTIRFDPAIAGGCNADITLTTPLEITDSVIVDAETLPGWSENTSTQGFDASLCVKIHSASVLNPISHAFRVPYATTASLTLRGVELADFQTAIILQSGTNHVIRGNRFGPALRHIKVDSPAWARIGGPVAAQRNHFNRTFTGGASVLIQSAGNYISGNLFGPDGPPQGVDGNWNDLELTRAGNQVTNNRFVESRNVSILARGSASTIASNHFEGSNEAILISDYFSTPDTGNDYVVRDNVLVDNEQGIVILDKAVRNRLLRNLVRGTFGPAIDLRGDGVINANSNGGGLQTNTANMGQNHPTLLQALAKDAAPLAATVKGELWARNGTYVLGFFASSACDASGHGEGEEAIGSTTVTVEDGSAISNGTAAFEASVTGNSPLAGKAITATATDAQGNSSEFSACTTVVAGLGAAIFRNGFE